MQEPIDKRPDASAPMPRAKQERAHAFQAFVRQVERAWPVSMVVMLVAMIGLWVLR
jgi:hypothetical protein